MRSSGQGWAGESLQGVPHALSHDSLLTANRQPLENVVVSCRRLAKRGTVFQGASSWFLLIQAKLFLQNRWRILELGQLSSALEEYFCASVAMSTENCKGVAPLALCSWTEREILSTLCVLTWVIIILPDTAYTFTIALLITIPSSN